MLNKIIVSTDDSMFVQYIPIVSAAWKKFFPEWELNIAYVTLREEKDPFVEKMRRYGKVHLFQPVDGVPLANQAKVSRHILASQFEEEVCMIEDMDTIPLQRAYFENILSKRRRDHVLAVGAEVFHNTPHEGKFPMSNITAEGRVFGEFVNPNNLGYNELIKSWIGLSVIDHKEAIDSPPHVFSDESLIRALLNKWSEPRITHVERGADIYNDWIDRSWWSIDEEKLESGAYITCNFLRPFDRHYERIEPITKYIFGEALPEEYILL